MAGGGKPLLMTSLAVLSLHSMTNASDTQKPGTVLKQEKKVNIIQIWDNKYGFCKHVR